MKHYILDTNIILDEPTNVSVLFDKGQNHLIIPDVVLDEVDNKKSGHETINYNARSFARSLQDAEILNIDQNDKSNIITMESEEYKLDVVTLNDYIIDPDPKIRNDRKIIQVAEYIHDKYKDSDDEVIFVTLDIMARIRAMSIGIESQGFGKKEDIDFNFLMKIEMEHIPEFKVEDIPNSEKYFGLEVFNGVYSLFYVRSGEVFIQIDDKTLSRQNVTPANIRQKMLSSLLLNETYNVVICDAPAGSGKNTVAISAAMRLLDTTDRYDKIIYIRNTIESSDVELGYLPGSKEDKIAPYLSPLFSSLEFIILNKHKQKKFSTEALEDKVSELVKKYNIQPRAQGFLRGDNIRKAIVILDECQNNGVSDGRTIISRLDNNSKLIAIGSNNQIDNKYINKHTSLLTFLNEKARDGDNMNVNVAAMNLTKTIRSDIAEWADTF